MIDELQKDTRRRMESAIDSVRNDLAKLRTGKASPALLDSITVNYYGSMMPIRQVANVSAPEPRLIVVQPWERNLLGEIEKAIQKADLGLNPTNDGILIRLPIPQLTEDRRRDLVKVAKKLGEDAKVAVRNVRRDANEQLKKSQKSSDISEDQMHTAQEQVQKVTDEAIKKIDEILEHKEKDIMEI